MVTSLSLKDELELMQQVAAGSDAATRKLVATYIDYVVSLAFRVVGNRHDAEEIAQEVFLKLFKQAERWAPKARISTWLYRVTYNAAIDTIRSRKRQITYELKEFLIPQVSDLEEKFDTEDLEYLEEAMSKLPPKYRAALTIFYFQRRRTRKAAEVMDLKEDAFESLLRRARKKLKEIMEARNIFRGNNETKKDQENYICKTGGTDDYQVALLYK